MHALANPTRFLRLADWFRPVLTALLVLSLGAGLYLAFFASPPDYQQGESVRIMYVHVPSAMMTTGLYAFMAIASAVALIWRHPLASLAAKAAAPVGAAFCLITLATGSLWGRPMWGTWWEWDGRMTSVLVQFFLYLGYMALWQAFSDRQRASNAAAILAIVGVINLVIIRFSVEWWNTLHQPASIIRAGGPTIDSTMLWPLGAMLVAAACYTGLVILRAMRTELKQMRLDALMSSQDQPAARVGTYQLEAG